MSKNKTPADLLNDRLQKRRHNRPCVTCSDKRVMKTLQEMLTAMIADPRRFASASIISLYEVVKEHCNYDFEYTTFRRHLVEDEPMWKKWLEVKKGGAV